LSEFPCGEGFRGNQVATLRLPVLTRSHYTEEEVERALRRLWLDSPLRPTQRAIRDRLHELGAHRMAEIKPAPAETTMLAGMRCSK
jgi:hypothetical protein